jgi:hypothetical protein
LLTSIVNNLHYRNVDHGVSYFRELQNWQWESELQDLVIGLNPANLPHSYRFLPNAFVRWLQLGRLNFEQARDVYRLIFGFLLFYAIYRYARLYTTHLGAILALLFVSVIYPVSFEFYGGQLTDPMSHLSFVLAFIFLETGDFGSFISALVIGSLAKETVLAIAGYYILFRRRDENYGIKAGTLLASVLLVYFGVRLFVLGGSMNYRQVSGVAVDHIWANLRDGRWPAVFLLTGGALVPFLVLAWKDTPNRLKWLTFYLLFVLFPSSLMFSWLAESRNFMPLAFVLAVISGRYLVRQAEASGRLGEEESPKACHRVGHVELN